MIAAQVSKRQAINMGNPEDRLDSMVNGEGMLLFLAEVALEAISAAAFDSLP